MIKPLEIPAKKEKKILKLTKVQNIYRIHLDNKESYLCNEDDMLEYSLFINNYIDDEVIEELALQDKYYNCLNDAYIIVNYKAYSIKQVKERLLKKKHDNISIIQVVNQLIDKDILNDKIFSESYIDLKVSQGYGPNYIKQKLYALGINEEVSIEEDIQMQSISKYFYKYYNETIQKDVFIKKFLNKMNNKGFSNNIINEFLMDQEFFNNTTAIKEDFLKSYQKLHKKNQAYQLKNKIKEQLYRKGYPLNQIDLVIEECLNEQN